VPELRHYELPSDAGGERAAAIYSLLGTAKLNGLDPELYLRHVLERIADHPINQLQQLLPWNRAAALPAQLAPPLSVHQAKYVDTYDLT
jgi:hypothetical protein